MCASDLRAQVRRGRVATRLLVALTLASTAWGALAQSGTDRDREQIRRLREQVRQQQQAQAEMQASQQAAQAELSRQKAAAEAATSAVRAQQGALQRRLQALQDEAAALRTERVRLQEETARLQAALAPRLPSSGHSSSSPCKGDRWHSAVATTRTWLCSARSCWPGTSARVWHRCWRRTSRSSSPAGFSWRTHGLPMPRSEERRVGKEG